MARDYDGMAVTKTLSLETARRLAVSAQLLADPRPRATANGILGVVKHLGRLQLDPTSVVARSHLLVLWSPLGAYDPAALDALLWERRDLFEYRAYIVPADDSRLPGADASVSAGDSKRSCDVREWMSANAALRRSILSHLRRRGPLRLRDSPTARPSAGSPRGGTTSATSGRCSTSSSRRARCSSRGVRAGTGCGTSPSACFRPRCGPRPRSGRSALAYAERELRFLPGASALPWPPGDRHPGMLLEKLDRNGRAQRVTVSGLPGVRYVHADQLALLDRLEAGEWEPRTTLLSPFDTLINDRDRTEALFGFRFRLEIYVPKAKRQYGYFVLPILHGDRLVGRIDPEYDRKAKRLRVNAVHWEPGAPLDARLWPR